MQIRYRDFLGMIPRRGSRLLSQQHAELAVNCDLRSGEIRPLRLPRAVTTVELGANIVGSVYRWRLGDQTYWFRFRGDDVDVIRAPQDADVWERVYFAGDPRFSEPRYTFDGIATEGGDEYPVQSRKLGVPEPRNSLDLSFQDRPEVNVTDVTLQFPMRIETDASHELVDGDVVQFSVTSFEGEDQESLSDFLNAEQGFQVTVIDETTFDLDRIDGNAQDYGDFSSGTVRGVFPEEFRETRFYTYTYVTDLGEQGPPNAPDNIPSVEVGRTQPVTVTIPPLDPEVGSARVIETVRLYRTASGQRGAEFQFLAELPVNETEFVDELTGDQLGEVLPSTGYAPPPADLRNLDVHPGGFVLGTTDRGLYASEPYLPHAWPDYFIPTEQEPVAIGVIDTSIVIATKGQPYLVTGSDPRSMQSRKLESTEGCVSKRSMVSLGYAVVYASANGLVMVDQRGARLITREIVTESEWAEYDPENIHAYEWNGRYLAFHPGGGFVLDPQEPEIGFVQITQTCVSAHRDPLEPRLYLLLDGGEIVEWDAGDDVFEWQYRSGVIPVPRAVNLGAMQVVAHGYRGLEAKLIGDGRIRWRGRVANIEPFHLPSGYLAREYQWESFGTTTLQEITIASSAQEAGQ